MVYIRSTSIFVLLCGITLIYSSVIQGASQLAPDIQEKILTLDQVQSITALLVKPRLATSTLATTTASMFKAGQCPQSSSKVPDDTYIIQPINAETGLPKTYVPKGLVDIRLWIDTDQNELICLTDTTAQHLYDMSRDLNNAGMKLSVVSGYRSYAGQLALYKDNAAVMNKGPYDRVAPAGQSEHQLGTTVDVSSEFKSGSDFAETDESAWIREHAYQYGFILSYEEGSEEKTGYMYEPWHLRYVGLENAALLHTGNYSLAYKPVYYKASWINTLLGRLKTYIQSDDVKTMSTIQG